MFAFVLQYPLRALVAVTAALAASCALAQDTDKPGGGGLRWSGFGTLGLSHEQAPPGWGYRRELTQPSTDGSWRSDVDTRLGLQLNYTLSPSLELVAQAIARKRGAYAADTDALEWAYASYRPSAEWALRLGRVNVDAFLMADYRNVGYGYLTARPPVELYARLPTTLDGGDVARNWLAGDVQWRAKLFAGSTSIGDTAFAKAFRLNSVLGGMLSREEGGWLVRASVARARIDFDQSGSQDALAALSQLGSLPIPSVAQPAQALQARLGRNGIRALFSEAGMRYEGSDWQWSAEFVRVSAEPLTRENNAYVTLGHRLGDWTPYLGYGRASNAVPMLQPPAWQAVLTPVLGPVGAAQAQGLGDAVTSALNGARLEQSSWFVGTRWDFHPQAALKLQYERIHVAAGGASLWSGSNVSPGRARVASAVVDFIF